MQVESIAECSKVLQNALEHSAILSTFNKLPFVIKTFILYILSGILRHVLLYMLGFVLCPSVL